jgi:hypothetical protein
MNADPQFTTPSYTRDTARQFARIVRRADGRALLQCAGRHGVIEMEMEGRPDGIRPAGYDSFLAMLQARVADTNGARPITPQDWMELDREFVLFQQRLTTAAVAAKEAVERGDQSAATRLYELCAADAQQCLQTIDLAGSAHPAGQLSAAQPTNRAGLHARQHLAEAYLEVIVGDRSAAEACIQAGIEKVSQLTPSPAMPDGARQPVLEELRNALETVRTQSASVETDPSKQCESSDRSPLIPPVPVQL